MADRYEPLPGVLELPGWLFRRLSRRGKLATGLLIGLAVAGLAVAAAILVPMITDNKREDRARERREAAQARRERVAQLTREQRPHTGTLPAASATAASSPIDELQRLVLADAMARVRSGELDTPVKRVECRHLDGTRDVIFACEAVTSDIPGGEVSRGGRIGYPYRARVHLDSGRFAFCRIAGRPGEGSLGTGVSVPLSAVCGG